MTDEVNDQEQKTAAEEARVRHDEIGEEVAVARLLTISPLLHTGLSEVERRELLIRICQEGWEHPLAGHRNLSPRTLGRWLGAWRKQQLVGLKPTYRRDRGILRAISPEVMTMAKTLKEELPRRTVARVIELLELRQAVEPGNLARATLQRHLQALGLTGRRSRLSSESSQRFEAKAPGDVWQTDEKFGPYLVVEGKVTRTRIFGFLDDHSRLITGVEAFPDGTEINLQRCFRRALETWHRPLLIYTDNGKVYVSRHLRQICADLGIGLTHARPYRAQSKGKIERFWSTLDGFIVEANAARYTSLAELNDALRAWVELHYNRRKHSALKDAKTPFEVYRQVVDTIPALKPDDLDRAFRRLETRRVHKDGTFSLGGRLFQVPACLTGQTIELRSDPEEPTDVWVYRGPKRIVRAEPFNPPAHLPRAESDGRVNRGRSALESSREYLAEVVSTHRRRQERVVEPVDGPEALTMELLLQTLDLSAGCLSKEDQRAVQGIFDTFGPFPRDEALTTLAQTILQGGTRRHITVYLQALVEQRLKQGETERRHE
jgi:putative transposase